MPALDAWCFASHARHSSRISKCSVMSSETIRPIGIWRGREMLARVRCRITRVFRRYILLILAFLSAAACVRAEAAVSGEEVYLINVALGSFSGGSRLI